MTTTNNKIGRWAGAGMMATTLLGTGVFILPQLTVEAAGSNAIFAWFFLTLSIIPVTYIFGKLSSQYPHSAGPAYFVEKAYSQTSGRILGLMFLLVVPIGAPAAVIMTFKFLEQMVEISGSTLLLAQIAALFSLYFLNKRGVQVSAKLQFLLTLIIVAIVIVLSTKGSDVIHAHANSITTEVDSKLIFSAAGLAFWSFLGVEAMSHLSNEFKHPKRDVIPAMMIGTIVVGIIYLISTWLVLAHPNDAKLSIIGVFDHYFAYGSYILGVLGIAGGMATINVYTASLARLVSSFAEQQVLPLKLAKKNRYGQPEHALLTVILIMTIVLVITYFSGQDLEDLINLVNGVFIIIYLATMLAAWRLLSNKHKPMISLGLLFCILLVIGIGWHMAYATILMIILFPIVKYQKHHASKHSLQTN